MTRKDAIEILEEVKTIDDSMFAYSQAYNDALDMAIEALKAHEPIEARLNLCESCAKEYAECEADKTDLVYGRGVGNDNIIGCPWYANRWKAQMPRVMTLEEVHNWINADTMQRDPIFEETRWHDYGEWIDPFDDYDTADIVGYGESVRCWTSRPTDEQRKAVKWDE